MEKALIDPFGQPPVVVDQRHGQPPEPVVDLKRQFFAEGAEHLIIGF
jgi:hypothetical protein